MNCDNPVSKLLAAYDVQKIHGVGLDVILNYSQMPTAGLTDLREALSIIDESYRMHVKLPWREFKPDEHARKEIWGEVSSHGRAFKAPLLVRTAIKQDQKTFKRGGTGQEIEQNATFFLAISDLWRERYCPKVGDRVDYRTLTYEVAAIYVDPAHYWLQTGFPLYLTCQMTAARFDSRFVDQLGVDPNLEVGAPSMREPL